MYLEMNFVMFKTRARSRAFEGLMTTPFTLATSLIPSSSTAKSRSLLFVLNTSSESSSVSFAIKRGQNFNSFLARIFKVCTYLIHFSLPNPQTLLGSLGTNCKSFETNMILRHRVNTLRSFRNTFREQHVPHKTSLTGI